MTTTEVVVSEQDRQARMRELRTLLKGYLRSLYSNEQVLLTRAYLQTITTQVEYCRLDSPSKRMVFQASRELLNLLGPNDD